MSDRAKEALRAESANLRATAQDVVLSGTYLYPFRVPSSLFHPYIPTPFHHYWYSSTNDQINQGILHLTTHPPLYKPLTKRLSQTLVAGVSITSALFFFTYVPQTAILSFTAGPFFAPIAAALLVLSEASAVTHFVARGWILRDALVDVFDAVLLEKGWKKAGPAMHERYFQLKGLSREQMETWVKSRRGAYTGLGMASVVLEMVPFASMVFEFSNAVGAALWAADLEKTEK
ncbi:hypothetical protein AN4636.2 [Aspergillus nidulans FGSC A4]|nr:hypothetical protein AN4636.2 [Aspergillus nidulans FGSC A4]|eukprot:XP_662240.1 hypothetical protein AN4636.2 [Aspergillus nidulans FGSC A4]